MPEKPETVAIGSLILHFLIPGCTSLKEKRGIIIPIVVRLRKEFNLSVAELDLQDKWQETVLGCAAISNNRVMIEKVFQSTITFCQNQLHRVELIESSMDIF